MGTGIGVFIIIFILGIIAYIIKTDVHRNDVYNNNKLKTKLEIEDRVRELKLKVLRAEADVMRNYNDAEDELEFYKAQLKSTEELLTKMKEKK